MAVDAVERRGVIVGPETQAKILGGLIAHVGEALVKCAVTVGMDVKLRDRQLMPGAEGSGIWLENELRDDRAWGEVCISTLTRMVA